MKNAIIIVLISILASACSSSRYYLSDNGRNKKYLAEFIRGNIKCGQLIDKPTIIVDREIYRFDFELKGKNLNISKDEIASIKLVPAENGKISSAIEILTKKYKDLQNKKLYPDEIVVFADSIEISKSQMQTMNPNDVAAIEIIKSDSALRKIGFQEYGGVIYISTRNYVIEQYRMNFSKISTDYMDFIKNIPIENELNLVSYYQNGKKIDNKNPEYDILLISKSGIKRIEVIKDELELKKYKEQSKTGIINVVTK